MRLTYAMLDAMLTALAELEAAGEVQGAESDEESERIMDQAAKAFMWVRGEMDRRVQQSRARRAAS